MCVSGISKKETGEKIFNEIIGSKFPNDNKTINTQTQEAEKTKPRHTITKLPNTNITVLQSKFKSSQEEGNITYKGTKMKTITEFSLGTSQVRR